jgi:hypothetical protein
MIKLCLILALLIAGARISFCQAPADSNRCKMVMDTAQIEVCKKPDTRAEFKKGGSDGFNNYLGRHLTRSPNDLPHPFTLMVTFIVAADGRVLYPAIKYPRPDFPDAMKDRLLSLFSNLPPYKPATCNGQPVAERVTQPVILQP